MKTSNPPGPATDAEESEVLRLLRLDTTPWYQKPNLRLLYIFLVPAAIAVEMTSGYDGSILNGLQAVGPWLSYFDNPEGALLGVITAAYSIGSLAVLPVVPYTNDTLGRKHSITVGSVIILIGAVLQTASVNTAMFIVSRIILGCGLPFCISGASQLIGELAHPRHAGVLNGLFNESWYVGAILAAGVTLGTYSRPDDWSWRLPSLIQLVPSLLQLSFIWFVPESPRWLLSKGRDNEAFEILVKYHGEGDRENAFVLAEFSEIRERVRFEMEHSKRRWSELLSTSGNRKRILIASCLGLFSQWSGNGLVSYYLAKVLQTVGIKDKRTQNTINLGLTCWNLVNGIAGAFTTKFLPRRTQFLIAFLGMTLTFSAWTGVSAYYTDSTSGGSSGNHQAAIGVVALIFIYYLFYNTQHPMIYVYLVEILPFSIRAKGFTVQQFFSRGGSAFNQFVNPIGLESVGWRFYFVYIAWLLVESLIVFFLYPETKGPTLEELATVFEGTPHSQHEGKEVDHGVAVERETV